MFNQWSVDRSIHSSLLTILLWFSISTISLAEKVALDPSNWGT